MNASQTLTVLSRSCRPQYGTARVTKPLREGANRLQEGYESGRGRIDYNSKCAALLLLPALSCAVIEGCRLAKLMVSDKLKINDLILLLLSKDGPLLRYMHVFKIMHLMLRKSL